MFGKHPCKINIITLGQFLFVPNANNCLLTIRLSKIKQHIAGFFIDCLLEQCQSFLWDVIIYVHCVFIQEFRVEFRTGHFMLNKLLFCEKWNTARDSIIRAHIRQLFAIHQGAWVEHIVNAIVSINKWVNGVLKLFVGQAISYF